MKANHILLLGDLVLITLFMLVGLQFHSSGAERLLPNLLPFAAAWLLAGYLTDQWQAPRWRTLWRLLPAMVLAAPLGVILRAAWLGGVALPLFTAITAAGLAAVLLVWRAVYLWLFAKRKP